VNLGEKRTETDFRERARIEQQLKSFTATLEAAATLWIKENLTSNGGPYHFSSSAVARNIIKRYGVTPKARECMGSTLSAIDQTSLTSAYSASNAHSDVWSVMETELEAGTEFPWRRPEGFAAILAKAEAAGTA